MNDIRLICAKCGACASHEDDRVGRRCRHCGETGTIAQERDASGAWITPKEGENHAPEERERYGKWAAEADSFHELKEKLATMTAAKNKALVLLHKALPYVQFYDDQDHPLAVEQSKIVCEELQDGIVELEEVE